MNVNVKAGWADKLKVGSTVLVQDGALPEDRPSDGYRTGTVERVSATEVVVNGTKYRRGKGRSPMIQYPNEGLEIEALNDPVCGRIWPLTAPVKREYVRLACGDLAAAVERAAAVSAWPIFDDVLFLLRDGNAR